MALSREDEKLQRILTDAMLIALEDGIITDDEMAILKQLKMDVKELQERIETVIKEGDLTDEEKQELKTLKKKILKNAYDTSSRDFNITKDERALISGLVKLIMFD